MKDNFAPYRRSQIAELRPWRDTDNLDGVSISQEDLKNGSPRYGDMIARNPKNHKDQWLVAKQYFEDNFERGEINVTPDLLEQLADEAVTVSLEVARVYGDQGYEAAKSYWIDFSKNYVPRTF